MNYVFLLVPKCFWRGRLHNISDIDRIIFINIVPDRYKEKFNALIKKYNDLDVIMTKSFPDSQALKNILRQTFYNTYLLSNENNKTEKRTTSSFVEEENINE